ncbi:MAG: hypothetical protein KY469_13610 [Actinobacteria bacterium]|nr:hypothetical protein [Actinomycetota bacterium]
MDLTDLDNALAAAEEALAPVFGPSTRRFIARLVLQAALPHLALPSGYEHPA